MSDKRELYFESQRLAMGAGGRFVARVIISVWYGMLTAAALVMVFTDLIWLQSLGVFLFLFLGDRLLHANWGDEPIWHMPKEGRVNLNNYLNGSLVGIVERASERAVFVGGDFNMWVLRQLLSQQDVRHLLVDRGLSWSAVNRGAIKSTQQMPKDRLKKTEILDMTNKLVVAAGEVAIDEEVRYVGPRHLFLALEKKMPSQGVKYFFDEFVKIK